MSTYLIDTSVLLDWLRDAPTRATAELHRLRSSPQQVALTQPVVMEVLMGAPRGTEVRTQQLLARFDHLDVDPYRDFAVAAELYRAAVRAGHPIRSSVDCLIAAVALRHDAILVHRDRDFRYLAKAVRDLRCLDTLEGALPE